MKNLFTIISLTTRSADLLRIADVIKIDFKPSAAIFSSLFFGFETQHSG